MGRVSGVERVGLAMTRVGVVGRAFEELSDAVDAVDGQVRLPLCGQTYTNTNTMCIRIINYNIIIVTIISILS